MNLKFHETKNEENLLIMALHRPFIFIKALYATSMLHIHFNSGTSLFKQLHEALFIFNTLICLRLNLFA